MQFRQQLAGSRTSFPPAYFRPVIEEHQAIVAAALAGREAPLRAAIHDHMTRHLDLEET